MLDNPADSWQTPWQTATSSGSARMAATRTLHKRQTSPVEGASSGTTDVPGVYWYTLRSGEIRFRCMWVSSNGVPEFKRGFPTKEAAKDHRTERMAEALRGGRIHTTETFGAAFQQWLRDKRSITQGTRDETVRASVCEAAITC
jgi:hypothetical protein